MRDADRIRILHMIDAAQSVENFLAGRSRSDFQSDQMLLFAVVHAIELVGEAASKVTQSARAEVVEVPWVAIVDMRNRLIHGYFDIDVDVVWKTATVEIPALLATLRKIPHTD